MVGAILGASLPCSRSKDSTPVVGGESGCQGLGQVDLRVLLTLRSLLVSVQWMEKPLPCLDPAGTLVVVEDERRCQLGLGQGRGQLRKAERGGGEGR